ncbi:MAG TPA: ABC transporter permease [Prolixibacteraceae bacterium]|nr:ABC transporter permease [Prolixibacteraceae bacterium]
MTSSTIYLFTTLIGPLISFIVLLSIFSSGVPRNIPVGVVDLDHTNLSRKITMWIGASPEAEIVMHFPNQKEAYQQMEEGKLEAIVVIPDETEKNILKGESQSIPVFINNSNILKGGFLQKGIYKSLATLSGGIKLQIAMKNGRTELQAKAKIQPVRIQQHVLFNPFGNYSYFLLSALLPLMIVVFTLLSSVFAVGIEVREGTGPDWLEHSGGSVIVALAGKLLPYTILLLIDVVVMNVNLFIQMGTPLHGSFAFIVLSEFFLIITYQLLGVLIISLTANLRLGLSLASAYGMMALTFSGLTFPQFAMPDIASGFSYLFPFTYWVKIFISQAMRGEALIHALAPLAALVLFIIFSVSFLPRLKRRLKDPKYWGKV